MSPPRGRIVRLDDGSSWTVGLRYGTTVAGWQAGDLVTIRENARSHWRFKLQNVKNGEEAPAMLFESHRTNRP